ncbi:methyltransferase domain-containing protein [Fodinicola feengrottensis]|uniref:Methyltransferase domain-containing protein n=1 Tax=Fodinicola feengrottensis TaxID=435914 RepID=A0ABN2IMS7_9ACTN
MGDSSAYTLDNAAEQAATRFDNLESLYDPGTIRHLDALGLAPGARCWELGAGSGSVARLLADRVGPAGHVLATDLNPRLVDTGDAAVVEVRQHDVTSDPLPAGGFDLIHARLVIVHLADPVAALARLTSALNPGGRLLIEDFDLSRTPVVRVDADHENVSVVSQAFITFLANHGSDLSLGPKLPELFASLGLVDIRAEGTCAIGIGESAVGGVNRANIEQVRDGLIASGLLTDDQIERFYQELSDPDLVIQMPPLISTTGTKL